MNLVLLKDGKAVGTPTLHSLGITRITTLRHPNLTLNLTLRIFKYTLKCKFSRIRGPRRFHCLQSLQSPYQYKDLKSQQSTNLVEYKGY